MRVPALITVSVLAALCGGCAFFGQLFGLAPVYRDHPVPAEVFEPATLAAFQKLRFSPPSAVAVTVSDEGKVEPGGQIAPDDYQPESYGRELRQRLDLSTFPSMIVVPQTGEPFTHAMRPWSEGMTDRTGCSVTSSYADATYRVIATFDYTGDGTRDWLIAASQQVRRDEQLILTFWLVVENPRKDGPLSARLLGMEERRGLAPATVYPDAASAKARLTYLRAVLRFPPFAE